MAGVAWELGILTGLHDGGVVVRGADIITGTAGEAAALEREGSQVLVIAPDAASTGASSMNPLDPATRLPSALAGRAQGRELAASVAALWTQS